MSLLKNLWPLMPACLCMYRIQVLVGASVCKIFLKMKKYRQAYNGVINTISEFDMYEGYLSEGNTIYAPTLRIQTGGKKTERIFSQVEHRVTKCRRCNRKKNNNRICKGTFN